MREILREQVPSSGNRKENEDQFIEIGEGVAWIKLMCN